MTIVERVCLLLTSFVQINLCASYHEYYFNQTLDHFNPQDTRSFSQKYLIYDQDWSRKPTSPILFYAGNEAPIGTFYNNTGFMFDLAPEFGALVIFCEHRYYGDTLPFGSQTFTNISNLKYLTVQNAIADYAVFLTFIKEKYYSTITSNYNSIPVIVFGGSYGGILAAACRIHYPQIFTIALASSAPIPMVLNTANKTLFFQLVTEDYNSVSQQCPMIVRKGYNGIINFAKDNNYSIISEAFNLCSELKTQDDITHLELWIRNGLLSLAMVDYPYSADFLGLLPPWPVNVSCNMMIQEYYGYNYNYNYNHNNYSDIDYNHKKNNYDGSVNSAISAISAMRAVGKGAGMYYNGTVNNELECFNLTAEFVECADQTGCSLGVSAIAEDFQMCTQMVYQMNTNNITDMFPPRIWELSNLTQYCNDKYGVRPNPNWMQIWFPLNIHNQIVNGKESDISMSNIIFSNGLLDPFHGGGYMESPGYGMPAIVIPHGAHHLDLRSANAADPQDVTQARLNETELMRKWLDEHFLTHKLN